MQTSYLCFMILQHSLQLFHHILTDGTCWRITNTHHWLENKEVMSEVMTSTMLCHITDFYAIVL